MESLLRDLKFAGKLLLRDQGFTLTAVLTLGLVIGANTTIFSVVDSVVLSPLPIPEAESIVLMYNSFPKAGHERSETAVPDYLDRLREVDVFEEQALYRRRGSSLGAGETPQRVPSMEVTPSLFRLLRIGPHLGRTFTEDEGELGTEQRVVLSFALWQRLYGGDPAVEGRDLLVDGRPYTVVGVMPEDFLFLDPEIELWRPLAFTPEQKRARIFNAWDMIGRLRPGATIEQAQEQIDALNARNFDRHPELRDAMIRVGFHTRVVPLGQDLVRDVAGTLYLLWGGVFLVLLIGCVNVANLTLVRATARLKELTTRLALGAGHLRVARQLVTESIVLTLAGGGLGLLVGYGGLAVLRTLGIEQIPRGTEIALDGTAALATLAVALVVGIVLGLIPLAGLSRTDLSAVLVAEAGRSGTSGRRTWLVRRGLRGGAGYGGYRRSCPVGSMVLGWVGVALPAGAFALRASVPRADNSSKPCPRFLRRITRDLPRRSIVRPPYRAGYYR